MVELSVHILGGVRVMSDGIELPVTSRRQRALLAALALQPGRPVSTDQLIDAVWGEEPPEQARTTLQTYVSRLRRLLGAQTVLLEPGGYRLADGIESDAATAGRIADEARNAADAADRADLALEALDLWVGPALSEFAHEPWFVAAAAGLEDMRANLTDMAGDALTRTDRADEAVELLDPIARASPLRESTQALLVDALRESGRAVEAVRTAERYRRRLRNETGLEPGGDLVAAEQRALGGQPEPGAPGSRDGQAGSATPESLGSVLPRPGRLIGRDDDLARLRSLLSSQRMVTVCGPGGVGKTRLVAELAAEGPSSLTIVVELSPVSRGEVAARIGAALRMRADRATPITIAEQLHGIEAVLVIDNAEHVVEEVRDLCRTLLDRCPGLRLLVTSRSRLDLPDETVHVLGPLATTGPTAPAIELLLERLAQSGRSSAVAGDRSEIEMICSRLDGLPLALELAAGRAAVLGVPELRKRLDTALDLVAVGKGDDRHDGLRQVVAWSYDLLEEPSRRLLDSLAVFEGEFDVDGAERIGSTVLGQPVSLLLSRLVDSSLVATTGVPGRYRLLEMIRQFGREQLIAGPIDEVERAHGRWLSEELRALGGLLGPGEEKITVRLDGLRDEIRGALRRAKEFAGPDLATEIVVPLAGPLLYRPDAELITTAHEVVVGLSARCAPEELPADLAAAGARLAFLAGALTVADDLVELAIGVDHPEGAARPRALHARGVLDLYRGNHTRAAASFESIIDDPTASTVDRLDALGGLGLALCYDGRVARATEVVERHRAAAEAVRSDTYIAFADYMQGEIDLANGAVDAAVLQLRQAADRAWSVGASFVWGIAATVLANVLVRHRRTDEARAHVRTLAEELRRTGTWTQLWTTLRLAAELLAEQGREDTAAAVLLGADLDPAAPRLGGADLERDAALRQRLRDHLGEPRFAGIATAVGGMERVDLLDRALIALGDG